MTEYNIKKGITQFKALVLISTISYILGVHTLGIFAQEAPISSKERVSEVKVTCYATTQLLSSLSNLDEGALIKTAGFYVPGDGGNALYRIQKLNDELQPNGADVIALNPKQCRISKSSIFKTKDNNKPSVLVWHPSAPLRTGFDNSDFDIRILRPFGKTQGRLFLLRACPDHSGRDRFRIWWGNPSTSLRAGHPPTTSAGLSN